jgi:hypothetical protein
MSRPSDADTKDFNNLAPQIPAIPQNPHPRAPNGDQNQRGNREIPLANMRVPGILNAGWTRRVVLSSRPESAQTLLARILIGDFGTAEQVAGAYAYRIQLPPLTR